MGEHESARTPPPSQPPDFLPEPKKKVSNSFFLHYFSTALALNVYQTSTHIHTHTDQARPWLETRVAGQKAAKRVEKKKSFYSPLHICRSTIICIINKKKSETVSNQPAPTNPIEWGKETLRAMSTSCLVGGKAAPTKQLHWISQQARRISATSRSIWYSNRMRQARAFSCGHLHAAAFITTAP